MLQVMLEQITKAKYADEMFYYFHVDSRAPSKTIEVIDKFPYHHHVEKNARHSFAGSKLVVNIMEGYRKVSNTVLSDLIFMIEDDIMIGNDFFKFHREVHNQRDDIFCSIGTRNHNREVPGNNIGEYYTSDFDYQSWGVCWKREVIRKWIALHANAEFYRSNQAYIVNQFPHSRWGSRWTEQAGLIRRIQEDNKMPIAFPYVGRAFHGGFYGKNRIGKHNMTMRHNSMVEFLRRTVFDAKEMAKYVQREEYLKDSMPCNLKQPEWDSLIFTKHYS